MYKTKVEAITKETETRTNKIQNMRTILWNIRAGN